MENNIYDSPIPFNKLMNVNENAKVEVSTYMNFIKVKMEFEDKTLTYCIDSSNHKLMWVDEIY